MTTIHPWQWTIMCHYASSARQAGNIVSYLLQVMATPPHRQLTRHAYPGQASTRAHHVVQPCRCTYVRWATSYERSWGIGYSVVATGFLIQPACPHHGHLAHTRLIERLWADPYSNGLLRDPYDMDDDERSGH